MWIQIVAPSTTNMNLIDVHLSMPVSPDNSTSVWVHTLSIPVESFMPLSLRPFKLLRYICYTLLAAHRELSLSHDLEHPPSPFPYEAATINIVDIPPNGVLDIYYHIDEGEQSHIFPLDP